jgi:hypothetical protein
MTETIRIETPADEASLPTIRMIIGGVGARCDLPLDEIDDIYLAVGELLRVAGDLESLEHYTIELDVDDDRLNLRAGPFHSHDLRARLDLEPSTQLCLNLCQLLNGVLYSFAVEDGAEEFSVTMTKTLGAGHTA